MFGEQVLVIDYKPRLQFVQDFRSKAVIIRIWGDQWRSLVETVRYQRSTIRFDLSARKSLVETPVGIKNPVRAIELQPLIQ